MVQKTKSIDMTKSKLILVMLLTMTVGYVGGSYDNIETHYVGIQTPVDESVCSYSDENVTITGCSFIDRYFDERESIAVEIINLNEEIDELYTVISELNYDLAFAKSTQITCSVNYGD